MVQLKIDEVGSGELHLELYCQAHHSTTVSGCGTREGLPHVLVELHVLSVNIHKILKSHKGSIHMASLLHCYNAECFPPLQEIGDGSAGVPLEHLLQAVNGVVVITDRRGVKKLVEAVPENIEIKYSDLV